MYNVDMSRLRYFSKSLKGGNFIKKHYRVMSFRQNVALVKVNKFVKFNENSMHFGKVRYAENKHIYK